MACELHSRTIDSPLGPLGLTGTAAGGRSITFGAVADAGDPARLDDAVAWLRAWLGAERPALTLPLDPVGTPFQRRVWDALLTVPYGETTSYGALARALGDPKCVRAVGLANGKNPLPIVIPCHRVIGADGSLVGYAGGLARKRWLLAHEAGGAQGGLFG